MIGTFIQIRGDWGEGLSWKVGHSEKRRNAVVHST
jgi:hypothetical protein